jgi:Flp pilus assembly protein protease CpaA
VIYVLALLAVPIAIADIKEFKIPNIYLKVLALFCAPFLLADGLGKISNLLTIFISLMLLYVLGIGMGDVKLLAIIAVTLNSTWNSFELGDLILITLYASVHLLIVTLYKRSIPCKIPLAPSIFLALAFI